mmetsp:Transcript_26327/g.37072  ORF Transcript_26327/g.37072 Transcript_26327/m.37072 type:complete len:169 (+) Transcript_26327:19-525(+)
MGGLFSSSKAKKEAQATTVEDNNKSQTASPEEQKPKSNVRKLKCAGCEKTVENEKDLYPYLNQNYCQVCMKAIKENNRRTVTNIKRQSVAISSAQVKQALNPQDTVPQSTGADTATQTDNSSIPSSNESQPKPEEQKEKSQEHTQKEQQPASETRDRAESDKYVEVNL